MTGIRIAACTGIEHVGAIDLTHWIFIEHTRTEGVALAASLMV
jgi:hypothetical protein